MEKSSRKLTFAASNEALGENYHRPQQVKKIHHAKENSISSYLRFL